MVSEPPDSPLKSLRGSNDGRQKAGVTTSDLMPVSKAMPGNAPKKQARDLEPPVELLGSGGKIPESYDARMMSQLPVGPNHNRKKQQQTETESQHAWWSVEARQTMLGLGCAPYKTNTVSADGKDTSPKAEKARAEKVAKEKAAKKREEQNLQNQKDYLLKKYTSGAQNGGPEAYRVMGQVSEINKQLGLPSGDLGRWFIKTNYKTD